MNCAHCGVTRAVGRHVCYTAIIEWIRLERGNMPAYNVAEVMQLFYGELVRLGFEETDSEPDRWLNREAGTQVWIQHSAAQCQIRYRRAPENPGTHAITEALSWDRSHSWNLLSRAHSGTSSDFARWLGQAAQTIETAARSYSVVAVAPGEE